MGDVKGPGSIDEAKGRAKTAYGEVTGDREKKMEGEIDKVSGKIKEGTEKLREKSQEFFHKK